MSWQTKNGACRFPKEKKQKVVGVCLVVRSAQASTAGREKVSKRTKGLLGPALSGVRALGVLSCSGSLQGLSWRRGQDYRVTVFIRSERKKERN